MRHEVTQAQRKEIARFAKHVCKKHGYPKRKTPMYRDLLKLYEKGMQTKENVGRIIMKHLPVKVKIVKGDKS